MDNEQARQILATWRAEAGENTPEFQAALELLARDPELKKWFAEQTEFDNRARRLLREIEPPPHLLSAILSEVKTVNLPVQGRRSFSFAWLAAVAAIVLIAFGSTFLIPQRQGATFAQVSSRIPLLSAEHAHPFASPTGDLAAIKKWLGANDGISDFHVPARLENRQGVGCEVTAIDGTKISIICFHLNGGGTAHLYVIARAQLKDPPPEQFPVYKHEGDYSYASWSEGNRSYFLSRHGDEDSVKKLLSL